MANRSPCAHRADLGRPAGTSAALPVLAGSHREVRNNPRGRAESGVSPLAVTSFESLLPRQRALIFTGMLYRTLQHLSRESMSALEQAAAVWFA